MKIILATPIYPPEAGGPATYVKELSERLRRDHAITVVALTRNGEAFPGTTFIPVGKNRPLPLRLLSFTLKLFRAAKHADLIYVQNAMAAGLPAIIAGFLRRKPVIVKFVGDEAWERATQRKLTEKRIEEFLRAPEGSLSIHLMMMIQGFVLRHAQCVTTPSAYLREEIIRAYKVKPNRAVVNYNAAEETETAHFEVTKAPFQICATARLVSFKGIDGIIRATVELHKKFPKVKLVIAGDGPEKENLERLTRELNAESYITFLGNVSRAETWQLRKESAVYVLNSTYEGLPHTALTSFAAEIPMVATNIPGTNEAVYHEQTGLLVSVEPEKNVPELVTAITRLFENPDLGEKVVEGGSKLLREKFSWESHLKTLERLFESVLSKPRK